MAISAHKLDTEVDYALDLFLDLAFSAPQSVYSPSSRLFSILCFFVSSFAEEISWAYSLTQNELAIRLFSLARAIFQCAHENHQDTKSVLHCLRMLTKIVSVFSLSPSSCEAVQKLVDETVPKMEMPNVIQEELKLLQALCFCSTPEKCEITPNHWIWQFLRSVFDIEMQNNFANPDVLEEAFTFVVVGFRSLVFDSELTLLEGTNALKCALLFILSKRCLDIVTSSALKVVTFFLEFNDNLSTDQEISDLHVQAVCLSSSWLESDNPDLICISLRVILLKIRSNILQKDETILAISFFDSFLFRMLARVDELSPIVIARNAIYSLLVALEVEDLFLIDAECAQISVELISTIFNALPTWLVAAIPSYSTIWRWLWTSNKYSNLQLLRNQLIRSRLFTAEMLFRCPFVFSTLSVNIKETLNIEERRQYLTVYKHILDEELSNSSTGCVGSKVSPLLDCFLNEHEMALRAQIADVLLMIAYSNPEIIGMQFFEKNWSLFSPKFSTDEKDLRLLKLLITTSTSQITNFIVNNIDEFERKLRKNWVIMSSIERSLAISVLADALTAVWKPLSSIQKDSRFLFEIMKAAISDHDKSINQAGYHLGTVLLKNKIFKIKPSTYNSLSDSILFEDLIMLLTSASTFITLHPDAGKESADFLIACLATTYSGWKHVVLSLILLGIPQLLIEKSQYDYIKKLFAAALACNAPVVWHAFSNEELDMFLSQTLIDETVFNQLESDGRSGGLQTPQTAQCQRLVANMEVLKHLATQEINSQTDSHAIFPSPNRTIKVKKFLSPPLGQPLSNWFVASPEFGPVDDEIERDSKQEESQPNRRLAFHNQEPSQEKPQPSIGESIPKRKIPVNFSCEYCTVECCSKGSLRRHMVRLHARYTCILCKKNDSKYLTKQGLQNHMKLKHAKQQ